VAYLGLRGSRKARRPKNYAAQAPVGIRDDTKEPEHQSKASRMMCLTQEFVNGAPSVLGSVWEGGGVGDSAPGGHYRTAFLKEATWAVMTEWIAHQPTNEERLPKRVSCVSVLLPRTGGNA
jgi:hypothetical protein